LNTLSKMPNDIPVKTALVPKRLLVLLLIGLLAFGLVVFNDKRLGCGDYKSDKRLEVGGSTIHLEVAESLAERERGLGGRSCMKTDQGMLFVFENPDTYCFWMKDMNYPLDMIWLGKDKKIVDIIANVQPESYPKGYCPARDSMYVIELTSGRASGLGLKSGQQLSF
jgi:uncharacterized protein